MSVNSFNFNVLLITIKNEAYYKNKKIHIGESLFDLDNDWHSAGCSRYIFCTVYCANNYHLDQT